MEEEFDAIIIGAGPAGSTAAYKLAQAGAEVLVVDRGSEPGSKNLSGAVLYGRVLNEIIPEFWKEAPVERAITKNHVIFTSEESSFGMVYDDPSFGEPPYNGFSVLRGPFDQWLAEKAESAGAMYAPGIKVDSLVIENGKVVGIEAAGEQMGAKVVIDAEGVNNFLAQSAGLCGPIQGHNVGVGIKDTIRLSEQTINDRFGVDSEHGEAFAIMGAVTNGLPGGGFLYTNKDTVSIGLVIHAAEFGESGYELSELQNKYLEHPIIAPLLEGGELVEYGAHLVNEGGIGALPKLSTDGIMLVGDAAGLGVNSGLVVRGIDLAIASGSIAADAVLKAKESDDFSAANLKVVYDDVLMQSPALLDMKTYEKSPSFMKNTNLYENVPDLVTDIFHNVYMQDNTPNDHIMDAAKQGLKGNSMKLTELGKLAWNGVHAI